MNSCNKDHVVHFITAFTMDGFDCTKLFYLVFEWADGGNLENVYDQNPVPELSKYLFRLATKQLLGIAMALYEAYKQHIRHGDLKPGNILCFGPTNGNIFGTLKIGDWGLAKFHSEATSRREEKGINTSTHYGTPLYEPPEAMAGGRRVLSRLYDMWSAGCVILEILIWLLYGHEIVKKFRLEIRDNPGEPVPCYELLQGDGNRQVILRRRVVQWMDCIDQEPLCGNGTVVRELLNLVRRRLLVIELPLGTEQNEESEQHSRQPEQTQGAPRVEITETPELDITGPGDELRRGKAKELVKKLDNIIGLIDRTEDDHWTKERRRRFPGKVYQDASGHLMAGPPSADYTSYSIGRSGSSTNRGHDSTREQELVSET